MRTVFIADDGTQFDDEWDCKDYEFRKSLDLDSIEIYGKYRTRYDPLSEDGYNKAVKIIVKTERAVSDLHKIAKYTGFTLYEDVNSVGTWIFKEHDAFRQEFVKEEEK